ncbi:Ppp1r27 [Symbiodinium sp. CCMP2592]|nr:Ppp1r27 [Symbiodinium sp. CCMP2592]
MCFCLDRTKLSRATAPEDACKAKLRQKLLLQPGGRRHDLAVLALRTVLRHWATSSEVPNRQCCVRLAGIVTATRPQLSRAPQQAFSPSIPGLRLALEKALREEAQFNRLLHEAVRQQDLEGARQALELGAEVASRDTYGWTALHVAASKGAVDICDLLIASGAKVTDACFVSVWPGRSFTPIDVASQIRAAPFREALFDSRPAPSKRRQQVLSLLLAARDLEAAPRVSD